MSLDKAIKYGKEKRKQYTGPKLVDSSCRNHGSCPYCKENRLHKFRDKHPRQDDEERHIMNKRFPRDCPVECVHLHSWGSSIDNNICVCDILNIQVKERDMDFDWHSCPLPDDAIEVEYE